MKILNIRFSEVAHLIISDLVDITKATNSEVARAALHIGLSEIRALAAVDVERAKEIVAINNLKSK